MFGNEIKVWVNHLSEDFAVFEKSALTFEEPKIPFKASCGLYGALSPSSSSALGFLPKLKGCRLGVLLLLFLLGGRLRFHPAKIQPHFLARASFLNQVKGIKAALGRSV